MGALTDRQKLKFYEDPEYQANDAKLQAMVQAELVNLVKARIEKSAEGQELLKSQLNIVKKLKTKVINDTDSELAIFNRFREVSAENPDLTYEEFCKQ